MGGIFVFVFQASTILVDMSFTTAFMRMKKRGIDDTTLGMLMSTEINKRNEQAVQQLLSRAELEDYRQMYALIGHHRMAINDKTKNAAQPFVDPIVTSSRLRLYPELRTRPKRYLFCDGEIYNYRAIIESHSFTDRDLQSESDVEVIMPLFIEKGIEYTLSQLQGDFAFVIISNFETVKLQDMDIIAARDPLGIRPLYTIMETAPVGAYPFIAFVSDLDAIESRFKSNKYTISEFPPGHWYSYKTRKFTQWHFGFRTTAEFDNLTDLYTGIYRLAKQAVITRAGEGGEVGLMTDNTFSCNFILYILMVHTTYTVQLYCINNEMNVDFVNEIQKLYPDRIVYHHMVTPTGRSDLVSNSEFTRCVNTRIVLTGMGLKVLYRDSDGVSDEFSSAVHDKLRDLDNIAANCSVEFRYPYLDAEFIEYNLNVAPKLRKPIKYDADQPPIWGYLPRKSLEFCGPVKINSIWT